MKKILISVFSIAVVGVVAFAATQAFFSDTETSTGNVLAAGAIDLRIDNTSYALDHNIPGFVNPQGVLVASTNTSWQLSDLTIEKFFNFVDLKPGDYGEDTISVHVNSNDAWLCAAAQITQDTDETCVDPELADDPNCAAPGPGLGELDQEVNFAFWKDDGDNVLENGETPFLSGPISGLNVAGQIALADTSTDSVFGQNVPIPGNTDVFIGKAWCFGTLIQAPVAQDGLTTEGPLDGAIAPRGTGFTCDGSAVDNAAQTDKVVGDLQFYAVQSRNNADFTCAQSYTPTWITRINRTQEGFGDGGWAGWSCPAGTTAVGGGIDSSTNPVGPNGLAVPSAIVGGFTYPVFPHYTFPAGETGYVVQDAVDGQGNTISFHVDCQAN